MKNTDMELNTAGTEATVTEIAAAGTEAVAKQPGIKRKSVSYAKWGVIFILPFFIVYITCSLIPQFLTIYNSFFENYTSGLTQIGPKFVGFDNYVKLFTPNKNGDILVVKYAINTIVMWVAGAIPQFTIGLLLAVWFTSSRLKVKGQGFWKTVIYMPNLIMASAFSMLFFSLFGLIGPVNQILTQNGILDKAFNFFGSTWSLRTMVAIMNFLMWFGNSTILFMAGIMGIDGSIFEAATIDGANSRQVFFKIIFPLLAPIISYTFITAMIGGIQMYDVPQVLTDGRGGPNETGMTLIMYLNRLLNPSKNYGMGGALSVVIFIFTAIFSLYVYNTMAKQYSTNANMDKASKKAAKMARKAAKKGVK